MSNKDAYIAKKKLQLDELKATMDELEARGLEVKDDAHDQHDAEMSKLRRQSQLTIDKLDELKAAGEDSWENLIASTDKIRIY